MKLQVSKCFERAFFGSVHKDEFVVDLHNLVGVQAGIVLMSNRRLRDIRDSEDEKAVRFQKADNIGKRLLDTNSQLVQPQYLRQRGEEFGLL